MNIYCKFHHHFKDILVCKLSCPRERKCKEFKDLYQEKGREIRWYVYKYMQKYPDKQYTIYLVPRKGRIQTMKQYVCIREGNIQILSEEEIVQRTKQGEFFQSYFEVGREMEIMIKLAPKQTASTGAGTSKKKSNAKSSDQKS
jgi:hypothetical protein